MKGRTAVFRGLAMGFLGLSLLGAVAWAVEELTVIEREATIRKDRRNYSPRLAVAKEGDKVVLLEKEESWLRVDFKGVQGWMNESAVTEDPDVVLSGQAVARGVRATEQSAAKRGFSPEVEREYRKDNPNLEGLFKILDEVEKRKYSEERIVQFLKEGQLDGSGNGGGK